MRYELKSYQDTAVRQVLHNLARAREDWRNHSERTAFALSSVTGSGKTVIAAAAIEALLKSSQEFDVGADPSAVVLWISKDPALNVQTRSRFIATEALAPADLVVLDKGYRESSLQTGRVYFINPAKLSKNAEMNKRSNTSPLSFWDVLETTINDPRKTLYVVLDEAHEGMKKPAKSEQTIVQKILFGNGNNPPAPVIWGISATPDHFTKAIEGAAGLNRRDAVEIDPKDVQASGLLKKSLLVDIPDEKGDFSTAFVRDATQELVEISKLWADYGEREGIDVPDPLMVIQIPNKTEGATNTDKAERDEDKLIHSMLETVRKYWPAMPADSAAHVLGDRGTIEVGAYKVPKIAPQDVQDASHVRVLVAKDAVSTGWDCPRAEVLVSLRPGRDPVYVGQLLGRMVRTPLAQNTSVERLNAASCFLPYFDANTARQVADYIMGDGQRPGGYGGGGGPQVLLRPMQLQRNPKMETSIVQTLEQLPSFAKPAAAPKPIHRLLRLAQALAQDEIVTDANKQAHSQLFAALDRVAEKHRDKVDAAKKDVLTAYIRRLTATHDTQVVDEQKERSADVTVIDDALRATNRTITSTVVNGYIRRRVLDTEHPVEVQEAKAELAALSRIDTDVPGTLEEAADSLARAWLSRHDAEIATVSDARKPVYQAIRALARDPERTRISVPMDDIVESVETDGTTKLPVMKKHVLSNEHGDFPLDQKLNRWERTVIEHELDGCAGWYRNPSSASEASLGIAYNDGNGWRSIQPDLIFVGWAGDVAIVDPHGAHLGDAKMKLDALVEYADTHSDAFSRVISIGIEQDGWLIGLDLRDAKVRAKTYKSGSTSAELKSLYMAYGAKYAMIDQG